ncbi:MAG: antiterminator LoaP [Bacillota bacterium]|jgi:transcriptional antiterminator NusG|nr:antiterminator LoaP [Bacillota bacterium]HOQ08436.1 antiterminator LoaP [Clostridiales bacterium]HQD32301.1 antiterminator LoaP [Clostridiales bacterium]
MEHIHPENEWYALFVLTGQEEKVKERIMYRFEDRIRVVVPKRILRERKGGSWRIVKRVLFPGYVLINGHIDVDLYYSMKSIPGMIKLIRSGYDPVSITEDEIRVLSRLMSNGEEIGISQALDEGGRIRITDGPLLAMEGYIKEINRRKGRAKVIINFLGEARTVELAISVLQPA